jgi:hypothetical protein
MRPAEAVFWFLVTMDGFLTLVKPILQKLSARIYRITSKDWQFNRCENCNYYKSSDILRHTWRLLAGWRHQTIAVAGAVGESRDLAYYRSAINCNKLITTDEEASETA